LTNFPKFWKLFRNCCCYCLVQIQPVPNHGVLLPAKK
jgi:hypothetical protein